MGVLADSLQPFLARGFFAGAVAAAADRDRILAIEAVGMADLAAGEPMRPDALFCIASNTKPITAAALMMLADKGRLSVDDPVAKYLPAFAALRVRAAADAAPRPPSRPVLVRDLLSHTAGFPFAAPEEDRYKDALTPAQGGGAYARLALLFDPGTAYQYSNVGINLAARVLEVAAGEEYEAFLQRRLFDPLGMGDTVFRPAGARLARMAKTYRSAEGGGLAETRIGQLRYPLDDPARAPMAGGGLFSTAADMLRFARMVLRGGELGGRRYLSEGAVRAMTARQTPPGIEAAYGLGWGVNPEGFGHGGALHNDFTIYPALGLVRFFLVQQDGPWGGDAAPGEEPSFATARAAKALVGAAGGETADAAGAALAAGTGTPTR